MNLGKRWLRQPQSVWARKALFQVHLWTGIGLGLYILVISLSGSAVVFRNELLRAFLRPAQTFTGPGQRLAPEQLQAAAQREFPRHEVDRVVPRRDPDRAVLIVLVRGGNRMARLFHPYTGEDLGHSQTVAHRFVTWLIDLHDNLLYGRAGRAVNGVGAIFATLLALTGAVIWWPGARKWPRSLLLDWSAKGALFHWSLHSMLGFWFFAFVLIWSVSGIYLAFPDPFYAVIERFEPTDPESMVPRFGDTVLYWLTVLHFGRWGGILTKTLWTIFGLIPAVLFVTGAYMWWRRVLRPALGGDQQPTPASAEPAALERETPVTAPPA